MPMTFQMRQFPYLREMKRGRGGRGPFPDGGVGNYIFPHGTLFPSRSWRSYVYHALNRAVARRPLFHSDRPKRRRSPNAMSKDQEATQQRSQDPVPDAPKSALLTAS